MHWRKVISFKFLWFHHVLNIVSTFVGFFKV